MDGKVDANADCMNEHQIIIGALEYLLNNPPGKGESTTVMNDYFVGINQETLAVQNAIKRINERKLAVILLDGFIAGSISGVPQTVHNVGIRGRITSRGVEFLRKNQERILNTRNATDNEIAAPVTSPHRKKNKLLSRIVWMVTKIFFAASGIAAIFKIIETIVNNWDRIKVFMFG